MTDEEVAIFIRQEYRTASARNSTIKARFITSREVTIDSNLDMASAQIVADEYLAGYGVPVMAFDIEVDGVIDLDDFVPCPPQYHVTIKDFCDGRLMRVVGAAPDPFKGVTTLTVMG